MRAIPTNVGILTLSALAIGCSDAHKVASAFEKVCKAECECPDTMELWNEVSNCKKSCRGYAIMFEAFIEDEVESEPCNDLERILADVKRCTQNSCGESRDECLSTSYQEFYECWDLFGDSYYYNQSGPPGPELVQQLLEPIPGALDSASLHSASSHSASSHSAE